MAATILERPRTGRLVAVNRHDDGVNAWTMRRFAPEPRLERVVDSYVDYEERTGGFTERRELPHGGGVLIINLGEPISITGGDGQEIALGQGQGFVGGVHLKPALSRSSGTQRGIEIFLSLEALRSLLGRPMTELTDRVLPLDMLLPGAADLENRLLDCRSAAERVDCLDRALDGTLARHSPPEPRQRHALALLRDRPELDLARVADLVGWSSKHLRTRMLDTLGVGPRTYRRLLRFERVRRLLSDGARGDWAGLALDAGYYDQSHMIREFQEFAGLSPSQFVARSLADGGGLVEG